ncbi:beta-1,3-galactosyltransferase 5-like [Mytilus trossulus]|uniref:beta-1,3-galactosyltransferase 5-like n=1 Tax=Mytilus trossulus TaxID=6551 RepID=UPI003004BFDA
MKFVQRVSMLVLWLFTLVFYNKTVIVSFSTYHQTMYNSFDKTLAYATQKLQYVTEKVTYVTETMVYAMKKTQTENPKIPLFHGRNISTEFESYYTNASAAELMDPFINQHRYELLINQNLKCKGKNIFLLVFIHVAPGNFAERILIRSTIGTVLSFQNRRIEHVFVLGKTENITLQKEIQHESRKYMDIIQGNFIDSYRNLTYKLVFSLFWVNNFCNNAKFVIKMDDDITINIPLLVPYLTEKLNAGQASNVLECKTITENVPVRDMNNKWFITLEEYPFTKFLPYCAGHSSLMSIDVVRKMYRASKNVPYLWLEDVYGSGFLSLLLKINMFMPTFYVEPVISSLHSQPCSLFYLNILKNDTNSLEMWNTITTFENRLNCSISF